MIGPIWFFHLIKLVPVIHHPITGRGALAQGTYSTARSVSAGQAWSCQGLGHI